MTPRLHLHTLGSLRLTGADEEELLGRRHTALALLVVIAGRAPASIRRDELLALFWGDRTEERARHSLRQELVRLRQVCGDALEVDQTSVRLDPDAVVCDSQRFAAAASSGNCADAIALWRGDFLPGCEDVGGEGFRAWLDVERERLRRLLAHCYERRTAEMEARQDWAAFAECAAGWAHRFPLDEGAQLRYIEALCKRGRIADASAVRVAFVLRLRTEMDDEPSADWVATADRRLREGEAEARSTIERATLVVDTDDVAEISASAPAHPTARDAAAGATLRRSGARRVRRVHPAGIGILAVGILALVGVRIATARQGKLPALAIGEITSALPADSTRGFTTLLTINLARISQLDVISERRLSEVAVASPTETLDHVARAAGAREILEGVLSRRPDRTLRADLRRTDLVTGKTRGAYTLEATDLTQLADLIAEQVARDLGLQAPAGRREATTRSIVAYRLYEQGLRAFYEGDEGAVRLFTAALAEDSTFAMAAFYKGLSVGHDSGNVYLAQALRHAQRTTDRERLLISVTWGRRMADPRTLAWADSLVTRYPAEADAQLIYAQEMTGRWNLADGLAHFRRVLEMDSANVRTPVRCRACDAADGMVHTYMRLDSLAAAERIARIRLRWQPKSASAWFAYSGVLGGGQRYAEAHAAIDSAVKYSTDPGAALNHTVWWFYANDFAPIDRMWRELQQSNKPEVRLSALWTRVIASRTQGRLRDALEAAREFRQLTGATRNASYASVALLESIVVFELGRHREAAAMFDSCARLAPGVAPFGSRVAADRAWLWTHAAAAYAAAGDTAALRRLEDSVRVNGLRAAERYHGLHYYVRGLRLAAEDRPLEAATFFRKATPEREDALVRIHLELARALLAADRPSEAIPPLVRALKGPTSATGLYATRTELQELLGLAYERSQKPDSAIVQYRRAVDAWRGADPEFAERRTRLQSRIAALAKSR